MEFLRGPDQAITVTGVKVEVRPYKPCRISNAVKTVPCPKHPRRKTAFFEKQWWSPQGKIEKFAQQANKPRQDRTARQKRETEADIANWVWLDGIWELYYVSIRHDHHISHTNLQGRQKRENVIERRVEQRCGKMGSIAIGLEGRLTTLPSKLDVWEHKSLPIWDISENITWAEIGYECGTETTIKKDKFQ